MGRRQTVMPRSGRLLLMVAVMLGYFAGSAEAKSCPIGSCSGPAPDVGANNGELTAQYFEERVGLGYAGQVADEAPVHVWRLQGQCDVTDSATGGCGVQLHCDAV